MTRFTPIALVCNMRSGRGSVARALPELRRALDERKLDHEVFATEYREHASELTRDALARGARLVVAVGGDGTIHEVVNGMMGPDGAVQPEAALGVVAAGTGSDFIKTFGLPSAPSVAAAHLDGDDAFPIDLGRIDYLHEGQMRTRYFANIAEVGIGAATVARAERLPRWFGPLVYFFAFWLTLARHRSYGVKVDLVDRAYEGPMNNLVVANGQFFGGGMKIAPKAAPTDGVFDIQIEHARKREAVAVLPKVYKGEHVPHPDIEEFKRVRVQVETDRPAPIEADGEVLGTTPATFEIVREAVLLKV